MSCLACTTSTSVSPRQPSGCLLNTYTNSPANVQTRGASDEIGYKIEVYIHQNKLGAWVNNRVPAITTEWHRSHYVTHPTCVEWVIVFWGTSFNPITALNDALLGVQTAGCGSLYPTVWSSSLALWTNKHTLSPWKMTVIDCSCKAVWNGSSEERNGDIIAAWNGDAVVPITQTVVAILNVIKDLYSILPDT